MDSSNPFGLYLFQKEHKDRQAFKDLLQLLKANFQGRTVSFSYVEAQTSLLPHLSLWENLQLVVGHSSWKEYTQSVRPDWAPLMNLIKGPDLPARMAQDWEKFTISLLKGLTGPGHLLIDVNEDLLSPLIIQNFKRTLLSAAPERQIYLASANSSVWLDCAHSIVSRKEYIFETQALDPVLVKRHWAA